MQWVCSITCLLYTSTIRGNADHSGATPMNLRHDALCGSSKIILGIEEVTSMQEEPSVVGTVGIAKVVPGAMNVIPGSVKLGVDIRSISKVARDSVVFLIKELIDVIAEKRGLSYTIEPIAQDHPVAMHPAMIREIEEAVKSVGVDYMTMSSGAGHDAMHWTEVAPKMCIRDRYGHVKIQVDPLYDGQEFAFVDKIFGGAVPKQYIPAVEKGAKETLEKGLIAGYPMIGVQVTLLDGSYHSVDSSELAFKVATSQPIKDVILKAKPVLLEPIYEVNVFAPDAFMGDIMGDLNSRRGRVLGMEQSERTGISVVKAQVPLAEMSDYVTVLRSMTQGQGVFNRQFYSYEEVPHKQADEIIAAFKEKE